MINEALWVTIRIPLVIRTERLIRVIPNVSLKRMVDRVGMYGPNVLVFREKENDKFHLMTQSTFDMCNILGNTRSCSTRDYHFNGDSPVIPVEFLMNRFMIVSDRLASIKITERCPNGVMEVLLKLDSVIMIPVNCSYSYNSFSIDTQEADVEITREISLVSIDKIEITKIENYHANVSKTLIESIANKTSSDRFERNRAEINEKLNSVDTKHENSWSTYNLEKWCFAGGIIMIIIVITALKIRSSFVSGRVCSTTFGEIDELRSNLRVTQNEFIQETMSLRELRSGHIASLNVESNTQTQTQQTGESNSRVANFSSPLSSSQFFK